eukprot:COSAG06_NODE_26145_length_620_cov_2.725528_1_plen_64_part_01
MWKLSTEKEGPIRALIEDLDAITYVRNHANSSTRYNTNPFAAPKDVTAVTSRAFVTHVPNTTNP